MRIPTLTSTGKLLGASKIGVNEISSKSGAEIVRRACPDLYCIFSTEQHPPSLHGLCEDCVSVEQRRNSRPGTDSSWQCADAGSQMKAARAKKVFRKCRTRVLIQQGQEMFKQICLLRMSKKRLSEKSLVIVNSISPSCPERQ